MLTHGAWADFTGPAWHILAHIVEWAAWAAFAVWAYVLTRTTWKALRGADA